jgi:hypothetical protein
MLFVAAFPSSLKRKRPITGSKDGLLFRENLPLNSVDVG